MSAADDLREAAKVLRERATAAQRQMPAPWRVMLTDSESLTGVASCERHGGHPQDACDACTVVETYSEPVAAYMATVGPLTGLALAELLDVLSWFPSQADPTDLLAASKLARQILAGVS